MKKIVLTTLLSLAAVTSLDAKTGLDIEVGTGVWAPEFSGNISYGTTNKEQIGINELGLDDKKFSDSSYIYADFSHFVPIIPNIRIENTKYSVNGSSTITRYWNDIQINGATTTTLDLTKTDFIAYWNVPLLDTLTNDALDISYGLVVEQAKGEISVNNDKKSFDEYIPLLYLGAIIEIPTTDITLEAKLKTINYDGATMQDIDYKFSYELPGFIPAVDLNLDLGYKTQSIEIPSSLVDKLDVNFDAKGYFFGINAQF